MKQRKSKNYQVSLPKVNFGKLFILIICFLTIYFFIVNSIVKFYIVRQSYKVLKNKLEKIKEENSKLQQEIYLLQTDTDTIEYYIRKNLNYKKPKEKILIIKINESNKK